MQNQHKEMVKSWMAFAPFLSHSDRPSLPFHHLNEASSPRQHRRGKTEQQWGRMQTSHTEIASFFFKINFILQQCTDSLNQALFFLSGCMCGFLYSGRSLCKTNEIKNKWSSQAQGCDIRLFIHAIEEQPSVNVLTAITFRCGCTIAAL